MEKIEEIISILKAYRLNYSSEKDLHDSIEKAFKIKNVQYTREYKLDSASVIDFFVNGIGIECKIKGPARKVHRQLERYAETGKLEGLILVTTFHMGIDTDLFTIPTYVFKPGITLL